MRRPSREVNIFSLSALDLFASATGAFAILAVILFPYYLQQGDADVVNSVPEPPVQPVEPQPPVPVPPTPVPPTPVPPEPKKQGFPVPIDFAIRIDWPNPAIDVDLHVEHTDPDGVDSVVDYRPENIRRPWGRLMRDQRDSRVSTPWEVFYAPIFDDSSPGAYRAYISYYSGGSANVPVKGEVLLYPSDPERGQSQAFSVNLRPSEKYKDTARLAVAFRLSRAGADYQVEVQQVVND